MFRTTVFLALIFSLICGTVYAEHTPDLAWMAPYKNVGGGSCCGENDCIEVQANVLSQGPGWVDVQIKQNGITDKFRVKQSGKPMHGVVHFHSNNTHDYWCYIGNDWMDFEYDANTPRENLVPNHATPENTLCIFIAFGG